MLADYVSGGGKLLVMAGPVEDGILENLYSLLSDYGVEAHEGIVVEADREHYAFQAPYVLLPDMASHDITDSLIEENYFPILPISLGLTVTGEGSGGTVTELLTTSDAAFSKAPSRWRCPWRTTAAGRWCGSPPPCSWRTCTTPTPPAPTGIWP